MKNACQLDLFHAEKDSFQTAERTAHHHNFCFERTERKSLQLELALVTEKFAVALPTRTR